MELNDSDCVGRARKSGRRSRRRRGETVVLETPFSWSKLVLHAETALVLKRLDLARDDQLPLTVSADAEEEGKKEEERSKKK